MRSSGEREKGGGGKMTFIDFLGDAAASHKSLAWAGDRAKNLPSLPSARQRREAASLPSAALPPLPQPRRPLTRETFLAGREEGRPLLSIKKKIEISIYSFGSDARPRRPPPSPRHHQSPSSLTAKSTRGRGAFFSFFFFPRLNCLCGAP